MLTTLFMLVYGDYFEMHKEAISPLLQQYPEKVSVRLWLNAVCLETFEWLLQNAPANWIIYVSSRNSPKYQVMRKLFNDPANPIVTPWVTWLDDDTNIASDDWLAETTRFIESDSSVVYFGRRYWKKHLAGVETWLRAAKWYGNRPFMVAGGKQKPKNRGNGISFMRGSYWWLKMPVLRALDWPDPRLRHNGGDTALAEAVWQARLPQHGYYYGIAEELAPRRGRSEKPAGFRHKLINATDGSVALMLGQIAEYEYRLGQANTSFVKLNESLLLIGGSADYEDTDWLASIEEPPKPVKPEPLAPVVPVAPEKPLPKVAGKKKIQPVANKTSKAATDKQSTGAAKTIRARLLERFRQKRERQIEDRRRVQRRAKAGAASRRRGKGG